MKLRSALVLFVCVLLAACSPPPPTPIPTAVSQPTLAPAPTLPVAAVATRVPSPTSTKPAIDTPDWFNDIVLYEIFPRSFYDTNGNGIGDLNGITAKLDYLQDLGVGALWLTPIFASPSYHGYDTTDYYKINPDFGTEADLVRLVNEAHERGIKVILDFVAGHTSDQHPFFRDAYGNPQSKYANWYRWTNDAHTTYEYFGSSPDLPRLNQDNPETRAYLLDVAKYWKEKTGIDGYRLDYALGVSHEFWQEFRDTMKAMDPEFLLLGEVWDSALKIAPYYDNQFDATFDFPLYFEWMGSNSSVGKSSLLSNGSPTLFESTLTAEGRLYNPGAQVVRFLNNHDTVRAASQLDNEQRDKLAATLLLTLPGTPMVYYGQEIGMRGDKTDGDKSVREPMDWYASESGAGMTTWYKPDTGFNKENDRISVQEQDEQPDSLLETYRSLIELRNTSEALQSGEFIPLPTKSPNVVAYLRRGDEDESFLVLLNFGSDAVTETLDLSTLGVTGILDFENLTNGNMIPTPQAALTYSVSLAPLSGNILRLETK